MCVWTIFYTNEILLIILMHVNEKIRVERFDFASNSKLENDAKAD